MLRCVAFHSAISFSGLLLGPQCLSGGISRLDHDPIGVGVGAAVVVLHTRGQVRHQRGELQVA